MMEQYANDDEAKALNVTPESMVAFVQARHYEIVGTETAFLSNMLKQAMSLTEVLLRLNWELLIAGDDTGFIICDCPVAVVPPRASDEVGFLVPGSAKYLPLSRNLCLRLGEPGADRRYRKVDKESVRVINQNIAANSERFIMGSSRAQLENIVSRAGCTKIENIRRFTIEAVKSDEDGSLQKLSAQPRRYFYAKDGSDTAP